MSAASDKRNARARAEGWSSYSQKYRAEKAGYAGKAPEYQAAVDQRKAAGIVKRAAKGRLLGGATTKAGTVISADLLKGQGPQLDRELARYRDDRRVRITIETTTGAVINIGDRGGMRLEYLRDTLAEGGWEAVAGFVSDNYDQADNGVPAIVTVVLV